jgi:hypothetical protein
MWLCLVERNPRERVFDGMSPRGKNFSLGGCIWEYWTFDSWRESDGCKERSEIRRD